MIYASSLLIIGKPSSIYILGWVWSCGPTLFWHFVPNAMLCSQINATYWFSSVHRCGTNAQEAKAQKEKVHRTLRLFWVKIWRVFRRTFSLDQNVCRCWRCLTGESPGSPQTKAASYLRQYASAVSQTIPAATAPTCPSLCWRLPLYANLIQWLVVTLSSSKLHRFTWSRKYYRF